MIAQHFGSQGQVVEEFERTVEWHVSAGSSHIVAPGFVIPWVCLVRETFLAFTTVALSFVFIN
jgi:jasmonate O-methyltransferase